MSDPKIATFVGKATSVGVVNVADRAVTLLLGVFLARLLEPSGYGAYSFVMSQVTLIAIVAKLGLPDLVLREFAASRGIGEGGTPKRLLQIAIALASSSSFILITLGFIVIQFFYDGPRSAYFMLGLLMIAPMAIFEIYAGVLRGLGHVVKYQIISTLAMTFAILSLCVLVFTISPSGLSAFDVLWIRLLVLCIFCVLVVFFATKAIRAQPEAWFRDTEATRPSPRDTLATSLSFLVIGVLHVLFVTVDQLMLGYMKGETSVAIFKVAAEGAQIVAFAYVAGNAVLAPEYSRIFASRDTVLLENTAKQSAAIVLAIASPVFLIISIFSSPIVTFAFGEAYAGAAIPLSILALGHFLALAFGDPLYILNMTGHHKTSMRLTIVAVFTNIILNLVAIPSYGVMGAALATTFSFVLLRLMAYFAVRSLVGIECSAIAGLGQIKRIGIRRE